MTNIVSILLIIATIGVGAVVQPQQTTKIPRIGILRTGSAADPLIDAFRKGLRDLGYIDGKNISLEYRWAEGKNERLPELATDWFGSRLTSSLPRAQDRFSQPSKQRAQSRSSPQVMVDPVGSRLCRKSRASGRQSSRGLQAKPTSCRESGWSLLKEIVAENNSWSLLWWIRPMSIGQLKSTEDSRAFAELEYLQALKVALRPSVEPAFEATQEKPR